MYSNWERRFEEWKQKNKDNPDRNDRLKLFFCMFLTIVMLFKPVYSPSKGQFYEIF
jgi:hypothetical protein